MRAALTHHWPEYLMEAAGLGIFMLAACTFATLLEHPASPVRQAISDPILRRLLIGLAMGLTAISLIYSPWGKQSGAHLNPSLTLTFWRLGKVASWDALLYIAAQFVGGMLGVPLAAEIYRRWPGARRVVCAKLHHHNTKRCIFRCGYQEEPAAYVY